MPRALSWILNALYVALVLGGSPFIFWAMFSRGKYRRGFGQKLLGLVPARQGSRDCVWLHAVSVGEVNLLATTLAEFSKRRPDCDFVISTTTQTGYDLACRKYGDRWKVFYCPLDFSWAVRQAMRRVRPDVLVLAELELWPNLIAAARNVGAKVAIINGRLSDKSFRGYRRARPLVRRILAQIDLIAAQDEATAERFRHLRRPVAPGPIQDDDTDVVITGSLKYDGAEIDRNNPRTATLCELSGFGPEDVVWLAGSTQAPEEEMALRIFSDLSKLHPRLRLVLVPRHPERFDEVARLLDQVGPRWIRRSELDEARQPPPVILVDTVGELGSWWGTASIGFVGGSFGDRGGQNMIEPAAYGVATCFGPNTCNFRDIVTALLSAEGACVVNDESDLRQFVARCLEDPHFKIELGERAQRFVVTQLGATTRTVDLLEALMPVKASRQSAAA